MKPAQRQTLDDVLAFWPRAAVPIEGRPPSSDSNVEKHDILDT